jgi:hypothetical protein
LTFRQMIDAVLTEHGFDVSEPTVKAWLNERYATMVVRARWRLLEVTLGTTVASQPDYALDDLIQELAYVYVGTNGDPYIKAGALEMRQLRAGTAIVSDDAAGAFSDAFSSTGAGLLRLFPIPTTAGLAITGLAAEPPTDLVADSDVPIVPADFHKPIVDGTIAIGLERDAERLQEATYFTGSFEGSIERLRKRRLGRIGGGPTQIRRGW